MKPDSTIYAAARNASMDTVVTVDGAALSPHASRAVRDHSPTGFNWGYCGSGPAQLALAILLDFTGDAGVALTLYQDFKEQHVARWADAWSIGGETLRRWVGRKLEAIGAPPVESL